jgi:hypothetical protein
MIMKNKKILEDQISFGNFEDFINYKFKQN